MYAPVVEVQALHEQSRQWTSDRVRLAGGKVFADGTLNSRTAWMIEPYADPLPGMERGKVITPPAELRAAMELVGRLDLGLAVHAIGDAAVRAVLDSWEATGGSKTRRGGAAGVGGLRIEHAELIDAADVPRFAALGVVASVQPCHLLADIEVLRRALPHRLDRLLPLRELIDAGCEPGRGLIFGSDAPIVRPHPEDSIQAAVHRRRNGMRLDEAIAPEQAIAESEAWACFGAKA
jgi:predicted amidohydrolase YtcJ